MSEPKVCYLCEKPMGDRDYFLVNEYDQLIGPVCEYCHEDAGEEERAAQPTPSQPTRR
jgi:hypothetical protein